MNITIKINADNAAFKEDRSAEIGHILEELSNMFFSGAVLGSIMDSNGNTCGSITITGK